jgi:hypothetical protein
LSKSSLNPAITRRLYLLFSSLVVVFTSTWEGKSYQVFVVRQVVSKRFIYLTVSTTATRAPDRSGTGQLLIALSLEGFDRFLVGLE